MTALIVLAFLNAAAHVYSGMELQKQGAKEAVGVFAFVGINLIIAVLLILSLSWSLWVALVFPAIGLTGLCVTKLFKGQGVAVDYLIAVLDVAMIAIVVSLLF